VWVGVGVRVWVSEFVKGKFIRVSEIGLLAMEGSRERGCGFDGMDEAPEGRTECRGEKCTGKGYEGSTASSSSMSRPFPSQNRRDRSSHVPCPPRDLTLTLTLTLTYL
jgi:hypothetical protein